MRKLIGLLALISAAGVSPVFATDPPPAETTSTPAKTEPSADAKATSTTTANPVDSQVKLIAGDTEADKQLKRLKAAGYKPEAHGDQVVFCRKEPVLGTRFQRKVCNTAEQLESLAATSQNEVEQMQRDGMKGNPSSH